MDRPELAVLLMTHERHQYLELIVEQIKTTWPDAVLCINMDRPTKPVFDTVQTLFEQYKGDIVLSSYSDVVTPDGEKFQQCRNHMLDQVRHFEPRYVSVWDDDDLLSRPGNARNYMHRRSDLIYCAKSFFWDEPDQIAVHVPEHCSVQFFRLRPGDRFPEDRIVHACTSVHDDPHATRAKLASTLLNYGLYKKEDRERLFERYVKAGKIEKFVLSYMADEPVLKRFKPRTRCPWHERIAAIASEL